jgi:hypothetical protein
MCHILSYLITPVCLDHYWQLGWALDEVVHREKSSSYSYATSCLSYVRCKPVGCCDYHCIRIGLPEEQQPFRQY